MQEAPDATSHEPPGDPAHGEPTEDAADEVATNGGTRTRRSQVRHENSAPIPNTAAAADIASIRVLDISPLADTYVATRTSFFLTCFICLALFDPPRKLLPPAELNGIAAIVLDPFWHGVALSTWSVGVVLRIRLAGVAMLAHLVLISLYLPEIWAGPWAASLCLLVLYVCLGLGALQAVRWPDVRRRFALPDEHRSHRLPWRRAYVGRLKFNLRDMAALLAAVVLAYVLESLSGSVDWLHPANVNETTAYFSPQRLLHFGALWMLLVVYRLTRRSATAQALQRFLVSLVIFYCVFLGFRYTTNLGTNNSLHYALNILLLAGAALAYWFGDQGRRFIAKPADAVLTDCPTDGYFLFLRSFADDHLFIKGPWFDIRTLLQGWGFYTDRFERVLDLQLRRLGPLVAIGEPGENLPQLGAAREYVEDAHWQSRVTQLIRGAKRIFVLPSSHEGLLWEIAEIDRLEAMDRVVFIIPPALGGQKPADKSQDQQLETLWHDFLRHTANLQSLARLREVRLDGALFVRMGSRNNVLVIRGDERESHYYRAGLQYAVAIDALPLAAEQPVAARRPRFGLVTAIGASALAVAGGVVVAGRHTQAELGELAQHKLTAAFEQMRINVSAATFHELSYRTTVGFTEIRGSVGPATSDCRTSARDVPAPSYVVECSVTEDGQLMSVTSTFVSEAWCQAPSAFTCGPYFYTPRSLGINCAALYKSQAKAVTPSPKQPPSKHKHHEYPPGKEFDTLRRLDKLQDEIDADPNHFAHHVARMTAGPLCRRSELNIRVRLIATFGMTMFTGEWQRVNAAPTAGATKSP